MGSGPDQNCTCTTRQWGQQHETINRSLRYLVTEEIEEQHIVYGQTAGWPDDGRKGYRISSTGLWPVEPINYSHDSRNFFTNDVYFIIYEYIHHSKPKIGINLVHLLLRKYDQIMKEVQNIIDNSNMTWFFSPIKSTDTNSALFPNISALAHWQ